MQKTFEHFQICLDNMDSSWAQKVLLSPDLVLTLYIGLYKYLEMLTPTLQQVVWFEVTIKDPEDDYYDYEYGLGKSYFQNNFF